MDWGTVLAAVISSTVVSAIVTGLVTWRVASRSLRQQRLNENTRLLTDLMAMSHARDPKGIRPSIGLSEQLGAIHAVAALGGAERLLADVARAFLDSLIAVFGVGLTPTEKVVTDAAKGARAKL